MTTMEQSTPMVMVEEDPDWMKYDPPEALNNLPNITSETIKEVVATSLENVRQQVAAEQLQLEQIRQNKTATQDTASLEDEQEGKGKERAEDEIGQSQDVGVSFCHSQMEASLGPIRHHRRSRFGITRILRHVMREDERVNAAHDRSDSRRKSTGSTDRPTSATLSQLVYKHIRQSSQSAGETL
jgi:hypothetical protein